MTTLTEAVEEARKLMPGPTVEPNSQNWAGMDGAVAYHLIDRHADNWADIGLMMGEWLAANQRLPKTPQEVRDFIGASCYSRPSGEPTEDDRYVVTAHDLLEAFSEWNDRA